LAAFVGCESRKPKPQPQSHVISSASETYGVPRKAPTHAVYTIARGDGTYVTRVYDHGKLVSTKITSTPP
jgi:hypothetical protein